jgi:hypothetical protein
MYRIMYRIRIVAIGYGKGAEEFGLQPLFGGDPGEPGQRR